MIARKKWYFPFGYQILMQTETNCATNCLAQYFSSMNGRIQWYDSLLSINNSVNDHYMNTKINIYPKVYNNYYMPLHIPDMMLIADVVKWTAGLTNNLGNWIIYDKVILCLYRYTCRRQSRIAYSAIQAQILRVHRCFTIVYPIKRVRSAVITYKHQ